MREHIQAIVVIGASLVIGWVAGGLIPSYRTKSFRYALATLCLALLAYFVIAPFLRWVVIGD